MSHDPIATALADALLAGPVSVEDFADRLAQALGGQQRWLWSFAERVLEHFGSGLAYAQRRELIRFIGSDDRYQEARSAPVKLRIRRHFIPTPVMSRRSGALADCVIPGLPTPGDLAAWLGISVAQLQWYADVRGMNRSATGVLGHYHCKWIPKRHGDYRLIESPKAGLRAIQRKILRGILDPIPVHAAAHGFRKGRSCMSYVAPHVGQQVVVRMDLRNFFGSIPLRRIHALFGTLGYPEEVARYLTGLCTHRIRPSRVATITGAASGFTPSWLQRKQFDSPHLPQGAPTSPALANLCALHLDMRLLALANMLDAQYTRYADDLAFSGDETLRRGAGRMSELVAAIALDEGFEVNFRKTRLMHNSDRQILTGIVVNERINVPRQEFDRLKAILHNCLRFGPEPQNGQGHPDFRAHLAGRVHHVRRLNEERGAKLQALLERIEW